MAFPLVMTIGGIAGMAGLFAAPVELGIALSLLVLGLAILAAWRPPMPLALLLIAAFAFCHGYAHGVELPLAAAPVPYAAGFVLATGLIHVCGIAVGLGIGRLWQGWVRGIGAVVAMGGLVFLTA